VACFPGILQALAAAQAELAEVQARYASLTRQYDEVVHKANLARQARERAAGELGRKEEEICALEVRLCLARRCCCILP